MYETYETLLKGVFLKTLRVSDPYKLVRKVMKRDKDILYIGKKKLDLKEIENVYVIGGGKASIPMAKAVLDILGEGITKIVISVYNKSKKMEKMEMFVGSHPYPDINSIKATKSVINVLKEAGKRDLIIAVISGGGSSLLCLPPDEIEMEDKVKVEKLLLSTNASIDEINSVRKVISNIKGGKLLGYAKHSRWIGLILSDVVGDKLDVVASGPTVPTKISYRAAINVLKRYSLWERIPKSVKKYLEKNKNRIYKTPVKCVINLLVGSNTMFIESLGKELKKMGFRAVILKEQKGLVENMVERHYKMVKMLKKRNALVCGGELTLNLPKKYGKGGRNLHYALLASKMIYKTNLAVLSADTDGIDGNSESAGAVVSGKTVQIAKDMGIDIDEFLKSFNSYGFFKHIPKSLITIGPTDNNLNSVMVWLK